MKKSAFLFFAMMLAPLCAFGVDGTVLINQSTVMAAGGFPYTISTPGSYRLSGNLIVPDANTTAIKIATSYVTLDMNGFGILGPTTCTGPTFAVTSCSSTGSGAGVATVITLGPPLRGIAVSNGHVKGMGSYGINLDGCSGCSVEKVTAEQNGVIGILTGSGRVADNISNFNGLRGIQNGSGPMLNNYAAGNKEIGIIANCPGSVIGNVTYFNGTQGLFINGGSCAAATNSTEP